jgi:hypothetical protein
MTAELLTEATRCAEFLKKHWPQANEWPDPIGWAAWYISNGWMATLHRNDYSIAAMAAGRPVNCVADGDIPFKHAKDGPCIFIDFLAIEDSERLALPGFTMLLERRFGKRKQIAYLRKSVHDYDKFIRNFGRLNISKIGEPHGATETA